jgi:hypothetical protein
MLKGVVRTGNTWQITLKPAVNVDDLAETGLRVRGKDVEVKLVARNVVTASFFGVPSYIINQDLTDKLRVLGVLQKAPWTRKTYDDYPGIESGIVFTRVELPPEVPSMPYAIKVKDVHITVKHNGQVKVCNRCLSPDHLARSCPTGRKCYTCGLPGHLQRECPDEVYEIDKETDTEDNDNDDNDNDDNDNGDDGGDSDSEDNEDNDDGEDIDWATKVAASELSGDDEGHLVIDEDKGAATTPELADQVLITEVEADQAVVTEEEAEATTLKRPRQLTTDEDKDEGKEDLKVSPGRRRKRVAKMKYPPSTHDDVIVSNPYAVLEDDDVS